ncbi:hypothetical protein KUTeg_015340 [Tegillarca granosa]|uniref:Methyltransferase FkbM domain-containing protein n=1 Tax=Tegillarca granosa TaxID=220873 RepID=A0ABQ9ETH2_TEGGR|nr:hypothetical protein KUTeg_015340 [Tegillarca granosa]
MNKRLLSQQMGRKYRSMQRLFQIFENEAKDSIWKYTNLLLLKRVGLKLNEIGQLLDYLKSDQNLNFIDIGANLGVFSLTVAKSGRKVLAIEALYKNVQRLCMSISDGGLQIKTFTLDNLLEFDDIKYFKNVVIKIDIEGYEYKAILGGAKFFDNVNIKAIFMEWEFHKGKESGKGIIEFMLKRNFVPYSENGKNVLNTSESDKWGWNIIWKRKKS